MFLVPFILVYEPEHLKIILGNARVSEKNFFYSVMHTFIGDGLVTSKGLSLKSLRFHKLSCTSFVRSKMAETSQADTALIP